MTLSDYLKQSGRGTLRRLSKTIGAHAPDMSRWASGERPTPPHQCVAIERVTGGKVTRKDLRPKDWRLLWPELAETKKKAEA